MLSREPTSPVLSPGLADQAAAGLVRNHGIGALTILAERAEMAEERGHRVAAETWRRIAEAAARRLWIEGADRDPVWPEPLRAHHAAPFSYVSGTK